MASSPVKFFSILLVVSVIGWILFVISSRLLAWFLSRTMGASVGFRVAGCNCLRDVAVKFKKGAIESISIGEIKLSLRKSLVKLGFSFISRDPKLQLLICDIEVVIRSSKQSNKTSKSKKSRSAGKGKWMVLTNVARLISVSVTDLVVKVPKSVVEVKDLRVDISKIAGCNQILRVKSHLKPFLVQLGDSRFSFDQMLNGNQRDSLHTGQAYPAIMEKNSVPFVSEDLSVVCDLGHDWEKGVKIINLDMICGDVMVCLNEDLFLNANTKKDIGSDNNAIGGATLPVTATKKPQENKPSFLSIKKHIFLFPEKVSFSMPKLDLKFMHRGEDLIVENNIMGIHLGSSKSISYEDSGETTSHFDVQMDLSEIHLLREDTTSILEILKVAAVASVDIPMEPLLPIRAEVDVKLGGTQCNLIMSRLKPWLHLHLSKKKRMTLGKENSRKERSQPSDVKAIMWTCTVSAPEMTIVLYDLNGLPLYHGCSQSSHLFANNIASRGIQVHTELGELHLQMEDEYQECMKENLFGVETNSGSLMHIARLSLDWGHREMELQEKHDPIRWALVFSVDISGMAVHFGFQHVESFISTLMSFKSLFKSLSSVKRASENRVGHISKKSAKGTQILKLNLEKCSVSYCGDMSIQDTVIADPKRVNFGSQGGEVIISVSADGTPRRASIISTLPGDCKNLKFSTSLDIFHLSLCVNREKKSTQMEVERARSVYQEYSEEHKPGAKVTLVDMQNAKFVRRTGGLTDIAVCSLFSATDISVRWEPDAHLALHEFFTRLRFLIHNKKLQGYGNEIRVQSHDMKDMEPEENVTRLDQVRPEMPYGKRESIFAVDVEMLRVSGELADGVETVINVQSIFSENARIGVLLEGLMLSFNEARVFKSSRMQISCIPVSTSSILDARAHSAITRDWVIRGLDIHICMPYRLHLRAIEDAVEDMLRGLKLITAAKTSLIFPSRKENSKKTKPRTTKFGSVRFVIRKLTADIEEEPIQGWLDEHYHLMKNEVCELAVRLKLLDESISAGSMISGSADPNNLCSERKTHYNGIEIDVHDKLAVQRLQEEIHKQTFRSYYQACQKMVIAEGSGACSRGFQSGFKPSTHRASLLSLCATDLDVSLTKIEGGSSGMVEFIKKLDPVCLENDIPFSRLYGRDIHLHTGSLVLQLRNYTFPLFSATAGKCQGRIVLAQQATCFQPQIHQDVYIGRWRRVRMLRSASGTTPPMKMYSDLPIYFHKGEVSFGVGYEPAFADVSYAFTVALRRANLSTRIQNSDLKGQNVVGTSQAVNVNISQSQPSKKERSLPWWDDMRYYIHGKIVLYFNETKWNLHATINPYEKLDRLQIISNYMDIQQTDGRVVVSAKEFKIYLSSLESLTKNSSLKLPCGISRPFLYSPAFSLEVVMDWQCDSGNPLNHYLHALPSEGEPRKKVYDPFRSTSLSLRWNFSLRPSLLPRDKHATSSGFGDSMLLDGAFYDTSQKLENTDSPTMNLGAHDLAWIFKWWNINYNPPHKLRTFSKWPRFGIPRAARSGNLSLDKVMTEFFLRVDATPTCIEHMPLGDDDPASGLTFKMSKLKYELCYSRGKQRYTFDCKRDHLDLVYQGLDLHMLKAYLNRDNNSSAVQDIPTTKRGSQTVLSGKVGSMKYNNFSNCTEKNRDDGFLLYSDYFTIRRQAPKADPARLLAWQESGRKNLEMTYVRSEFENGSESDHTRSDPSDDDGFNVVIADNCQRVFVYGLKLLWTIENRDAVWSWVGGISKAFELPKPSPSRQYAQRKMIEEQQIHDGSKMPRDDNLVSPTSHSVNSPSRQVETVGSVSSPSPSTKMECSSSDIVAVKHGYLDDSEEEGTRHFMVNVIQPQFNLHSEEANGRFLLAAASGRVLARSFHSVLHVGYEMIEQALGTSNMQIPESEPEMTWKRAEFSVMLEHVQAHVAPTDVDPGAGLQWLPKILRSSPKVKRTGALLERVFMPCQMYFRYTRHKGGTVGLKVKPLKELSFNSPNITATMTSRQFQVMLDVLSNLLFARLPKPRKSSLLYPSEDDEDIEEEADEVVPDGVEEVELAKINLEQKERERKLLLDDIRTLSEASDVPADLCQFPEKDGDLWMITSGKPVLVQGLKKELVNIQKSRKAASSALRMALQKAAQLHLMEKEKNRSPSYAMRISMRINKVVWNMLADGKSFAEAEISDMICDFDRDYKDIGVSQFTTKSFVVRNCLPNAKSDMLLSAWNAPPEWGKNVMLRVDAKQGAPKDGNSPLELFQVEIYPLKIYLTETMYRMMWDYFFPEEEQDSQRRQEVWKVSTTAGSRRLRKNFAGPEAAASSSQSTRESEVPGRSSATTAASTNASINQASNHGDASQVSKLQSLKANIVCGSNPELWRTSSSDRTWEENVGESAANELVLQAHSSNTASKSGPLNPTPENQHAVNETSKNKPKESKSVRSGRLSHEEKKVGKSQDEKRARTRKMMEFHNIKISQVELLLTYEGSRFAVNDLRLLMDSFHRVDFTGTWRRLFSRVKKHIIWGVLKSVTGMQGKKFKDKALSQREANGSAVPESDLNFSDSDGGQPGKSDQFPISLLRRPRDGAGDGFVTSIRGLFNSQRRRAKAFVLRTMRGDADSEFHGESSDSDVEFSPFARQLTITKAKKLIRHAKKFRPRGHKSSGLTLQRDSFPSTPRESTPFQSDSSGPSSYEDFHD
ncbi:protein SABRE isoform X1 [Phoenix dactylifera]|uniref:Protein SABRE isoform X1 n=2 Tax=Phoenix dactylifera TaxID=42345 RepID=A0A8B7C8L7_PHODC|nr:protein SABRE isoform X1 [Phoenix dactylifera]